MKLHKLLKSLKKESKITFWLSLLPITLLVGILWQIAILSKYNALVFFSWWQVLNDTAILLLPVIFLFISLLLVDIFVYILNLNPIWLLKKFFISIINSLLILIILWLLRIIPENLFNYYFMLNWFYYIFWLFLYILVPFNDKKEKISICTKFRYFYIDLKNYIKNKKEERLSKLVFFLPIIAFIFIFAIIFFLSSLCSIWYKNLYEWTKININWNEIKVNYMNDKYIIYSSWSETKIIPNDWKNEFIINDTLKN